MTNAENDQSKPAATKTGEKVSATGSHEDFGQDGGTDKPGGDKDKGTRKEETGATESGREDKGAKE